MCSNWNALSAIEVNVSGIVQEVPSSERRRRASALVKAGMLEEEEREANGVSNESTKYRKAIYQGTEDDNTRRRIGLWLVVEWVCCLECNGILFDVISSSFSIVLLCLERWRSQR